VGRSLAAGHAGALGAYQGRMNVSCSASFLVKAALWLVVVGAVLGVVLSQ